MISKNRSFTRLPPDRDAKSIYIFCEGAKREYQYFLFFKGLDSRVNVEVHKLNPKVNNSPLGLLEIAKACLIQSKNNPCPKYELIPGDEVWIVFDTDDDKKQSRKPQIAELKNECNQKKGWFAAQSNPCFEVWLYYHFYENKPILEKNEVCSNWKQFLNSEISGGFDSKKHALYIETAISNSKKNYKDNNGEPAIGTTELFYLAENMCKILKSKINKILQKK